jgi:hypothetical protein
LIPQRTNAAAKRKMSLADVIELVQKLAAFWEPYRFAGVGMQSAETTPRRVRRRGGLRIKKRARQTEPALVNERIRQLVNQG